MEKKIAIEEADLDEEAEEADPLNLLNPGKRRYGTLTIHGQTKANIIH